VGIRRASLLYHFRDKASLYGAVLESLFDDLIWRYRRVLDGGGSAGARLERTVDAWLDFAAARPGMLPIMLREVADGMRETSRPFADRAKPVFAALGEIIAAGQAERALRRPTACSVLRVAGASTFLTFGARCSLRPRRATSPIADRAQQRELLMAIFRKL
jgi:AcrR family transcriptional regulator